MMRKKICFLVFLFMLTAGVSMPGMAVSAAETDTQTKEEQNQTSTIETKDGTGSGSQNDTQKETEVKKKQVKKGNCDKFIGLSKDYWVLATAKKTVRVYKKQSVKSTVLGKFTKNNCIVVNTKGMKKGKNYSWLRVYLKNNKPGYIRLSQVSLGKLNIKNFGITSNSKKNRQRIKICRYGLPYMGTKFVLGGSSLKYGIDCSTFARKAMRNAGVKVSSHALAVNLAASGKKIKRSQLKPGDMVFYYNSYKDKRIGHCAIYIGSGYIINASGHQGHNYPSGGIRISRIDYRKPTAVRFRNLVGN